MATVDKSFRVKNGAVIEGASGITAIAAATKDSLIIKGRADGTSSRTLTIEPAALSANQVITFPDLTGIVALLGSPAFTGTPTAPTAAVDTNTTQLATTAFVLGQGYAKLASPTFTGTPLSTTAAADTNTTQIATTAFVIGQASSSNPVMDGSVAIGSSFKYARADHVHPTDTTRAPINNPTFTGTVTLAADPTLALHAATKQYVDNVVTQINYHEAVKYSTTGALGTAGNLVGGTITPTYNNGTSGVGATLTIATSTNWSSITIDGQSLTVGDRVLIKDQADGIQNGIYIVTTLGSIGNTTSFVFTRATDADNSPSGEVKGGDFVFVLNGTTNAGFGYVCSNTSAITVGTTAITFATFNTSSTITAGTGLQEATPGTLSIDSTVATLTGTQTLTNKTLTDSTTFFQDESDNTKKLQLQLSGIATTTTRTLTAQDASGTIALLSNHLGQFASTTSAQLAGVISDETGTGALVFANTPTLVTPNIGAATATSVALTNGQISSSTVTCATAGTGYTLDTFAVASFTSAKYMVQGTSGNERELTELLVTVNAADVHIAEYGNVMTSGDLFTITATLAAGTVTITVTPTTGNGGLVAKAMRTVIAV